MGLIRKAPSFPTAMFVHFTTLGATAPPPTPPWWISPSGKTNGETGPARSLDFPLTDPYVGWGWASRREGRGAARPGSPGHAAHTDPASRPPDILVPLDVEAVEVVVGQVAAVPTLLEPLDDGQLHAHGDVGRQHRQEQVLLGSGGRAGRRQAPGLACWLCRPPPQPSTHPPASPAAPGVRPAWVPAMHPEHTPLSESGVHRERVRSVGPGGRAGPGCGPAEATPHLPVPPGGGRPTCRRPRGDTPHPTCCRFSTRSFLRIWMHLTA